MSTAFNNWRHQVNVYSNTHAVYTYSNVMFVFFSLHKQGHTLFIYSTTLFPNCGVSQCPNIVSEYAWIHSFIYSIKSCFWVCHSVDLNRCTLRVLLQQFNDHRPSPTLIYHTRPSVKTTHSMSTIQCNTIYNGDEKVTEHCWWCNLSDAVCPSADWSLSIYQLHSQEIGWGLQGLA